MLIKVIFSIYNLKCSNDVNFIDTMPALLEEMHLIGTKILGMNASANHLPLLLLQELLNTFNKFLHNSKTIYLIMLPHKLMLLLLKRIA